MGHLSCARMARKQERDKLQELSLHTFVEDDLWAGRKDSYLRANVGTSTKIGRFSSWICA